MRYPCPCCGHLIFGEPPGSYEICPICFWEDDPGQLRWPDYAGGANSPSLIESQRNYVECGAMEPRFVDQVRPASEVEPVDVGWRPVDPVTDVLTPIQDAGWPDDLTDLYYWRPTYWRRT